ncbi:uncharacterized protein BT62DRAFT_938782 [Guyanagaster necrorhizus]|uniref:Uncharacterized protein n=1 Tax=Guyanagaster necrorhizus TaxID=856835 RepID=A0A9P7VF94_9AGAR|nr:uncharacterized protein BT62DRAFT_938782 [Guyanagaster necrorhizus MCA 3950]KAG7439629.1 hypothetical protein BT62DRAFT_938782 [Guyanagaster necrorhizus MCA 3950]
MHEAYPDELVTARWVIGGLSREVPSRSTLIRLPASTSSNKISEDLRAIRVLPESYALEATLEAHALVLPENEVIAHQGSAIKKLEMVVKRYVSNLGSR